MGTVPVSFCISGAYDGNTVEEPSSACALRVRANE